MPVFFVLHLPSIQDRQIHSCVADILNVINLRKAENLKKLLMLVVEIRIVVYFNVRTTVGSSRTPSSCVLLSNNNVLGTQYQKKARTPSSCMVFKNNNVFSVWYQNKARTVSSHVLLSKNNIVVAWYWVEPYEIDNSCFYQKSTFSVCGIKTKQLFLFQCKMVHI